MVANYQIAKHHFKVWCINVKAFYYELAPLEFKVSDHETKFGMWLYNVALVAFRGDELLEIIDREYIALHLSANKINSFRQNNHVAEAKNEFEKFVEIQKKIAEHLVLFESKYKNELFIVKFKK